LPKQEVTNRPSGPEKFCLAHLVSLFFVSTAGMSGDVIRDEDRYLSGIESNIESIEARIQNGCRIRAFHSTSQASAKRGFV